MAQNNKTRCFMNGSCYVDGLVRTEKNPYTILELIFANQKKNLAFFINIFKHRVDKRWLFLLHKIIFTSKTPGSFLLLFQ